MAKVMNLIKYATPFSILHAVSLLAHRSRIEKFKQALEQVITPDTYCIDIGTGTGILAILAAKIGAKKVTAIDINPESIEYAKKSAELNNVGRKIEFVRTHFKDFIPPDRADVVTCEMLSSMLFIEQQIPASYEIVQKMMKPGGILVPSRATVFLVPVESEFQWNRFTYGNLSFPKVPQTTSKRVIRDLAPLQILEEFDFYQIKEYQKVERKLEFKIDETGSVHGLVGMFEAELLPKIKLTMDDGWRELFLPLENNIEVKEGDIIQIDISYIPGEFDSLQISSRIK
ncbi:MAG: hypothetical protein BAJATHORv1_30241 [Candidatus Thorarchaeota archaeon]|nr:MAG: hypothetical protein BAJATHORv1_30241 [Candidatus Thorarchaeota archaeon]